MFHGLFALCFTGAYLTSESERFQIVHASFGYTIVSLLIFRLIYGWLGPQPVHWSSVLSKLKSGRSWSKTIHRRAIGLADFKAAQNFVLVLTTSSLLVLSVPLLWSGHVLYVSTSDWLDDAHGFAANTMLLSVLMHLSALLLVSAARGTNLATHMWSGRVPGPGPDLVSVPRIWLAIALLLISSAFGFWAAW
jgi:cytochrome b